ncbi:sucrase ferredoxin, partial [Pseudonocardia sp. ICBG1293]|uniref:sucrase ferredoxin n=1 Tax=Pseudonocardia sp. ICBG1293 TaxID=2844382 RepID=UPI001CCB82E3
WFRVDARPGHEGIRTGTWAGAGDLAAAVTAEGDPYDAPLTLVCAHGRHDACCAVRGRPLAAALVADDPEGTWECSHIGGCRFAPAMVLLPHGLVYGGVSPLEGPSIVRDAARGLVVPSRLRGRSALSPAVQAAQQHARLATGSPRLLTTCASPGSTPTAHRRAAPRGGSGSPGRTASSR